LEETTLQDHHRHTPANPLPPHERPITLLLKRKDGLLDSGVVWRVALQRDMDLVRAGVGVELKRGKNNDIIRGRLRRIRRLNRVDGGVGVYRSTHHLPRVRVDGIGMIMGVLGVHILVLDLAVHADGSLGMKNL